MVVRRIFSTFLCGVLVHTIALAGESVSQTATVNTEQLTIHTGGTGTVVVPVGTPNAVAIPNNSDPATKYITSRVATEEDFPAEEFNGGYHPLVDKDHKALNQLDLDVNKPRIIIYSEIPHLDPPPLDPELDYESGAPVPIESLAKGKSQKLVRNKNWVLMMSDDRRPYYENHVTQQTQWDKPLDFEILEEELPIDRTQVNLLDVPTKMHRNWDWAEFKNDAGKPYYVNGKLGKTQWEKPSDFEIPETLAKAMELKEKEGVTETEKVADVPTTDSGAAKFAETQPIQMRLNPDWKEYFDPNGKPYYINAKKGLNQWNKPDDYQLPAGGTEALRVGVQTTVDGVVSSSSSSEATPKFKIVTSKPVRNPDWKEYIDPYGTPYYINEKKGLNQWEKPDDFEMPGVEDVVSPATVTGDGPTGTAVPSTPTPTPTETNPTDDPTLVEVEMADTITDSTTVETQTTETATQPRLNPDWKEYFDSHGKPYYINAKKGLNQWNKPDDYELPIPGSKLASDAVPASSGTIPSSATTRRNLDWEEYSTDKGKKYYVNSKRGKTQWEKPDDWEVSTDPVIAAQQIAAASRTPDPKPFTKDEVMSSFPPHAGRKKKAPAKPLFPTTYTIPPPGLKRNPDWLQYETEKGDKYYIHQKTQHTVWEEPSDFRVPVTPKKGTPSAGASTTAAPVTTASPIYATAQADPKPDSPTATQASSRPAAAASADAATSTTDCTERFFLYSVQGGEGFSLRRDAFVRMSLALIESKYNSSWTLVLPPLTSRLSPHWHQGIPHPGIHYQEGIVPWNSLFDLQHVTQVTGLKFIEYDEWLKQQALSGQSYSPDSDTGLIDTMLHFCNFHYTDEFHKIQNQARVDGRLYHGSYSPKEQTFLEFACMKGEKPPKEGFCGNAMPQFLDQIQYKPNTPHEKKFDQVNLMEYGAVRLRDGKENTVHCGLSNILTNILPHVLDEYMSPAVTSPSGQKVCTAAVTNSQLVFWPSRPYWGLKDPKDPSVKTHYHRDRFIRAARLAAPLRELAHLIMVHRLKARPAIMEGVPSDMFASADLSPAYLSFHLRRGDFKWVHKSVVPDFASVVSQVRAKFLQEQNTMPTLSKDLFVSSDMTKDEWNELTTLMHNSELQQPLGLQFHRLEISDTIKELRPHFSPALIAYIDETDKAHKILANGPISSYDHTQPRQQIGVPITPFHVLLTDQYLCEQSRNQTGFLATKYSYVSEMIWNGRRAWSLEDPKKWEKATFDGPTEHKPKDEL